MSAFFKIHALFYTWCSLGGGILLCVVQGGLEGGPGGHLGNGLGGGRGLEFSRARRALKF